MNKRNRVHRDFEKEFPYFKDSMTMAYAFDDIGNKSAVNAMKKLAYEKPENIFEAKIGGISPWSTSVPEQNQTVQNEQKSENISQSEEQNKEIFPAVDRKEIDEDIARRFPKKKVTADSLNIRKTPGLNGEINGSFLSGTEIMIDVDSAVKANGYTWVKIIADGKEGWVAAEYLEDIKPAETYEPNNTVSYDEPEEELDEEFDEEPEETDEKEVAPMWSDNDNVGWQFVNEATKPQIKPELLDPKYIQNEFNKVGDFDGYEGLQCPDLPNWYINTYTDLKYGRGDGKDVVDNLANANDLAVSKIPKAPAIYSVDGYHKALGTRGLTEHGHTGIVLDVKDKGDGSYDVTYIHTYYDLHTKELISVIKENENIIPNDKVSFVYIGDHMK